MRSWKLLTLLALVSISCAAFAASKPPSIKWVAVKPGDYSRKSVTIKEGSKKVRVAIACLGGLPGEVTVVKSKRRFTRFSDLVRSRLAAVKIRRYKLLNTAGKIVCKDSLPPNSATPTPSPSSGIAGLLSTYSGPFGTEEAHILYNRFGFGGTPDQISHAVSQGLAKTVDEMMTYVNEPDLDATEKSLQCDGRFPGDPDKQTCDATDPNDINLNGLRYGIEYRFWKTKNQFFDKVFMWLHDERLSTSTNALTWCDQYAGLDYVNKVRNAARYGDYKQYMRDMNSDALMHLEWLSGKSNTGSSPNENYAREFWELGTVGPTDLSGNPVYSDLDIANSALSFSGHTLQYITIGEHSGCYESYVPILHRSGPKVVFRGTPYEAVVESDDDVLEATFRHPRLAEHLAEDLWKEFISPDATVDDIRNLAQVIRDSGYNLLPVFRQIMLSNALFDSKARGSLIKHPVDLMIGFLRQTGIPFDYITYYLDNNLSHLAEQPLQPPTVFGWNPEKLSGESYVRAWRDAALGFTTANDSTFQSYGYNIVDYFLKNLPSGVPSEQATRRIASYLGVTLNDAQIAKIVDYMDYDYQDCQWNSSRCNGAKTGYYLDRNAHDPLDENAGYKVRGVVALIAMLPEYRVK